MVKADTETSVMQAVGLDGATVELMQPSSPIACSVERRRPAGAGRTETRSTECGLIRMTLIPSDAPYALVVDDDFVICMHAREILEEAGFRVRDASSGDEAFELLQTCYSDVVLLFTDVQMPGHLDGFALARKVAESWPHISIVVASGHVSPGPGSMPPKARFVAKPFSAELVHGHLQELLPDGHKPEPLKRAAS